jgi:hypothetical protein
VIRDLDNLVEMEVEISGEGYFFRGQTSGVAGKDFQACGVALPPTLNNLQFGANEEKSCHNALLKTATR